MPLSDRDACFGHLAALANDHRYDRFRED